MLGIPLVKQETESTCGPASLLAVARYWLGKDAPPNERALYARTKLDEAVGVEPVNIARAARSLGLQAVVLRDLPIDYYVGRAIRGVPSILLIQAYAKSLSDYATSWVWGHYVVFTGRNLGHLTFMDPGNGEYARLRRSELYARWRGYDGNEKRLATAVLIEGAEPRGAVRVTETTTRGIP